MPNLFLLFNHRMTPDQEADARHSLGVVEFIEPPADIQALWGQIPPEYEMLSAHLQPVRIWLATQAHSQDYVLIQGDFGACFYMAQVAFELNLRPLYATTRRDAIEEYLPDGSVRLTHRFRHIIFRKYERLAI